MTLLTKNGLARQLPRLFDDFFRDGLFPAGLFDTYTPGAMVPDVNILENNTEYHVEIAAPGLEKKDFNVEVTDGVLTISAQKEGKTQEDRKNYRRREFYYNSFSRSFTLPENLLTDKIDARYENGILKLTLPKKQTTQAEPPKQIKVG